MALFGKKSEEKRKSRKEKEENKTGEGENKRENKENKTEKELTDAERLEQGQVFCRVILEILGKPKEHIEETLRVVVDKIKADPRHTVLKEEFSETEKISKLFSQFVEMEMWFKDVYAILDFCFDYYPSSIEILEPQRISYETNEFSGLLNDLLAKLHNTDMIAKTLRAENAILKRNANGLLKNIVTLSLSIRDKSVEEISKDVGIAPKQLQPFLDVFEKQGKIKKLDNNKYVLVKVI